MRARNGPDGYGWITRVLHWGTLMALGVQFAVGYRLDLDDCDPPGEELSGGETSDAFEERLDRIEERCEARADEFDLLGGGFDLAEVHVLLGLTVLALGVTRALWRRVSGLPPWSEALSARERWLAHHTERVLLALLVVVPLTGLVLVLTGDDVWLPLHVGAHLAFFAALAAHLYTNARPPILRRMI